MSTLQAIQSLSRGYSQSDYPSAATETQRREKKNLTNMEMMILRVVTESWLPKSTFICKDSLFFVQIEALYS